MKDMQACAIPRVPFAALQPRDLNIANAQRNHKISKLKADLARVNIRSVDSSSHAQKLVQVPKTAKVHASLHGVDLQKIRAHLHATRSRNRLMEDPLAKQTEINRAMRATLFNWLCEVAVKFQLSPRTIFLCANVFDRYCASTPLQKKNLQLCGITCLYIASKFEDVQPPRVRDLCYLCNDVYTTADILTLEASILCALNFDLICVTPFDVVELNMAAHNVYDAHTHKTIMCVLHTFVIQGMTSMVDAFKLAAYTCTLVQGSCSGEELSSAEAAKLEQCLKQMMSVVSKYKLTVIERDLCALPRSLIC